MITKFFNKNNFNPEVEIDKIQKMKLKFPSSIPIIITYKSNTILEPNIILKFIVPNDFMLAQVYNVIKKRINIKSHDSLCLLINGRIITLLDERIDMLYKKYKKENEEYLHLICSQQNAFG